MPEGHFPQPTDPLPIAEKSAEGLAQEFEAGISAAFLRANPDSREALEMLGHALTRAGRHSEALDVDRRLVQLQPDNAFAHYNLACSLSNMGNVEEALGALETALKLGYDDLSFMEKDPDLARVRRDPRYRRLLEKGKRHK